jgi:hypothetical protein
MNTYEGFTAALERRPVNVSPLTWLADLDERPPEASAWILRWLEEQRELEPPLDDDHRFNPAPFCAKCGGPCQSKEV